MISENAAGGEQLAIHNDIVNNGASAGADTGIGGAVNDEHIEEFAKDDEHIEEFAKDDDNTSSITKKSRHGKHVNKHCTHEKCNDKLLSGKNVAEHVRNLHNNVKP